jgi:hypothetical protein
MQILPVALVGAAVCLGRLGSSRGRATAVLGVSRLAA